MNDKLGREIAIDSFVVAPRGPRELAIGRVIRFGEKMIRISRVDQPSGTFLARPQDVVVVEPIDILAYKLK